MLELRKRLSDEQLGSYFKTPLGTHILQIYWVNKDEIDLNSRWNVRFRQTFFQNEVRKVLYGLVLVTDPLDCSGRIYLLTSELLKTQQNQICPYNRGGVQLY